MRTWHLIRDVLVGRVDQYLQDHGDTERWDNLAVPPRVPTRDEPILPATLAGPIVAVHGWGLDLPESLTHRISFTAQAAGVTLLEAPLPVAALAGRGAVVWYAPATPDDATIVEAYGGYLWDVPPYLLNVTPVITVGSEELARGSVGVGMGRPFDLVTLLTTPGDQTTSFTNTALAGVPVGIGIAPGRQGYAPAGSEPVNTVEMLSVLATEFLDQTDTFRNELAAVDGLTVVHPFPSVAAVASVVEVQGSLGIVTGLAWQGVVVDADLDGSEIAGRTAAARARWRILEGLQASTLERRIFESREITGVTADKALMLANLGGTPIVHITRDNLQTALDTLSYDANIEAEIATWVLGGGEAEIPEAPQALLAWQGVGYLLTDPATGQARYQLAGALSGGMTAVPRGVVEIFALKWLNWPPVNEGVNKNPLDVASLEVNPNCQDRVGTAGQPGPCHLAVRARDTHNRTVQGAQVTFDVVFGYGTVSTPTSDEGPSVTVITTPGGVAEAVFRLGQKTDVVPVWGNIESTDEFATQLGLNAYRARVEPVGITQVIYQYAAPGPLATLGLWWSQVTTLPRVEAGSIVVTASDEYGNPIANAEITATLQPQDGALVGSDQRAQYDGGTDRVILLDDIAQPTTTLVRGARSDGRYDLDLVLGPQENTTYSCSVVVRHKGVQRQGQVDFISSSLASDDLHGFWSARPVDDSGAFTREGYAPGVGVPQPFYLDVLKARTADGGERILERVPKASFNVVFRPASACPPNSATTPVPSHEPPNGWATGLVLGDGAGFCSVVATVEPVGERPTSPSLTTTSQQVASVVIHWTNLDKVVLGPRISAPGQPDRGLSLNEPALEYWVAPVGFVPTSQHVEVYQDGKLIQEGRIRSQVARLSKGQEYAVATTPTARIVLNRDVAAREGDHRFRIEGSDGPLPTAAIRIDRSNLPRCIDTVDRINGYDVLRLGVDRTAAEWKLEMPDDLTLHAISSGTAPLNPGMSYWQAKVEWHAIGLYDEDQFGSTQAIKDRLRGHGIAMPPAGSPTPWAARPTLDWTVPFPADAYDGGDAIITVEVPVEVLYGSVRAQDVYHVRVRGERQTNAGEIEAAIDEWVAANISDPQEAGVVTLALKGAACRENGWRQFCPWWGCSGRDYKTAISNDGGYGLMQLTNPGPDFAKYEPWDWVRNLTEAARRTRGFYLTALTMFRSLPAGVQWGPEELRRHVLGLFNGGGYYRPIHHQGQVVGFEPIPFANSTYQCCGGSSNDICNPLLPSPHNHVRPHGRCYADRVDCLPF